VTTTSVFDCMMQSDRCRIRKEGFALWQMLASAGSYPRLKGCLSDAQENIASHLACFSPVTWCRWFVTETNKI